MQKAEELKQEMHRLEKLIRNLLTEKRELEQRISGLKFEWEDVKNDYFKVSGL